MPAHDHPLDQLVLTFARDGEVIDTMVARDGERAALLAQLMIEEASPLQHGDSLTVREVTP